MSRHLFEEKKRDVIVGWDQPSNNFFCEILNYDQLGDISFDYYDFEDFKNKLKDYDISLSDDTFSLLLEDKEFNR